MHVMIIGIRPALGIILVLAVSAPLWNCSGSEKGMIRRAESLYQDGDYEEVIFVCRRVLKRNPESGRALYFLGAAKLQLGQDPEAEQLFDKALRYSGATPEEVAALYFQKGEDDAASGSYTRAKFRILRAHELDSGIDFGRFNFTLGDAYFDRGDFEQAAPLYESALRDFPDTTAAERALFRLGTALERTGREDEARDAFGLYLNYHPTGERKEQVLSHLQDLYLSRAELEFEQGNYEECLPLLEEILRYTENPLMKDRVMFLMGQVFEAQGEFDKARDVYLEIVSSSQAGSLRIRERAVDKLEQFESIGLP